MKIKTYVFLFVAAILSSCTTVKLRTADDYYDQNIYEKAIPYYEEVLNKKLDVNTLIKLADCYRNTRNFKNTEKLYAKIITYDTDPLYKYYYAEALMQNGKYKEARKWLNEYLLTNRSDTKAINMLASCDSIETLFKDSLLFNIQLLKINGAEASNFSPVYYRSGIVYVSNRNPHSTPSNANAVSEDYNLFYAQQTEGGNWLDSEPLRGTVNSIFTEGPCTFNKDFTSIYITRNNNEGKKIVTNRQNQNVLKIYHGTTSEGEWNITGEMSFNSNDYSIGHPTLSPSGNVMVFVSDMPWGYGGTDLYKTEYINGAWKQPVSLGRVINSPGNEMFPFLLNDSVLYFSSDGKIGIGGLDIYRSEFKDNSWTEPENMGYPINSSKDDFGFICKSDELEGFFSSNRINERDQIFSFTRNAPILTLQGQITDKGTGKPVKNIKLVLSNGVRDTIITPDANGNFSITVDNNMKYTLRAEDKNYFTASVSFNTNGYRRSATINQDIAIEKLQFNKSIIWRGIAFDKGSTELIPATKLELNKLFNILTENKGIKIELSCHTDSRGNDRDNLILSQARADNAAAYLIEKGISKDRIVAVGFGSLRLLNNCRKGVLCLEEDHQINIRTEIKYMTLNP
ncbi:MAG: OmpA family protein [Bacteroidetes bacterium]|jgi:outer membrane protein OmpA-like peptidoglycan-associated protein|nr:OmpA family protein [Bacteroidota bacterium]